jgi:translocation and assembly module TamA
MGLLPALCALLAPCWLLVVHQIAEADTVTVELSGVEGDAAANVRAMLRLVQYGQAGDLSELNIRNLHSGAERQIATALRPFGYYYPSVTSTLEQTEPEQWVARYDIDPGQPVVLRDIDITVSGPGAGENALLEIRDTLALTRGETLSHRRYEQAKARLAESARDLGYRDAAYITSRLTVDPAEGYADVTLALATGVRYRFGELRIEQDVVDDDLIRRYSTFESGDPFSNRRLIDFEFRLFDSGYFSQVQLLPQPPEGDTIPILLMASPGPKRAWNLRGGYGTDTGPRIGVGFESRRLNRQGHRLLGNLELSSPRRELTGQYIQPLRRPASDLRSFQLGVLDQKLGDIDSTRYEASVRESRRDGPWNRNRYLRFSTESNATNTEDGSATLLIPGYTLLYSNSNNVTYPTRGRYAEIDLHGGHDALLSDVTFAQLRTDLRLIQAVGKRNRVLLRGELGAIASSNFEGLPASERFFAGGDRSVRGFGLNQLAPINEEGEIVGGRYLFVASAEYEQRIVGNWGVAGFVDAGNAFNDLEAGIEAGFGVGLRWLSPIGMVRFDIAQPITDGGDGFRLHFTFGPEM